MHDWPWPECEESLGENRSKQVWDSYLNQCHIQIPSDPASVFSWTMEVRKSKSYSVTSDSLQPNELQLQFMGHTQSDYLCDLSFNISWSLLKLMFIELVMPSNYLSLCGSLFLLPSIILIIRVFSNDSVLHIRWPKYWRFSFSISPSNEYSRLISFGMDWFDLLGVQRTLRNLPQHHSSKAPILQHSTFFIVQLSQPYVTTGNTTSFD